MIRAFHDRQAVGRVDAVLDALLALHTEAALILDAESLRILRANPAATRLLGFSHSELESSSIDALFANDAAADSFAADLQRLKSSAHPATVATTVQTASGELMRATHRVLFIPTQPEQPALFADIIRPTFGSREAYDRQALPQASAAPLDPQTSRAARAALLGEFAASMAHEISQPLTAMLNFASAGLRELRSNAPDVSRAGAYVESATVQARRAVEIVRKLTDFIRGNSDARAVANLNDAVVEAVNLIGADARSHQTTIVTEQQPDLPHARADAVLIQQVVLNLLKNAIEAMRKTPRAQRRLVVTTRRTNDEMIAVSVRDCGSGAPPEATARLFDPFYSTKPHGLGLGLTISRSIVEAHGGELWATAHPDGGMIFTFTLPAVAARSP